MSRIAKLLRLLVGQALALFLLDIGSCLAQPEKALNSDKIEIVISISSGAILAIACSPEGRLIASGGLSGTLIVWDAATGRVLRPLSGHSMTIWSVAFSPDGRTIASASKDKTVKLWDAASGRELRTLTGHSGEVTAVSFSPDGHTVVSGSRDKTLKVWDIFSGQELRTLMGHSEPVSSVVFMPDGRTIASASEDKTLKLWDVMSGRATRTLEGHSEKIYAVAASPDGRLIASGAGDSVDEMTVKLWDVASGRELRTLKGHSKGGRTIAFSPDGRMIASGSWDTTVKLWDVASGRELRTLTGHSLAVWSVAFSPDGRTIASGGQDGELRLWDAASGREQRSLAGYAAPVVSVAASPDGRTIVSANADKTVKVWELASGRQLKSLAGHASFVYSAAFSPDGLTIVSGSADKTLKLWDVAGMRELIGHSDTVKSVAFSPDGRSIVSGSFDKTLKVWDRASGRQLNTLLGHASRIYSAAFSPDGRTIVSGSMDETLKLWDAATGRELRTLTGHLAQVIAVVFSPDGRTIASASDDKTVKLWDAASGRELRTLMGHTGMVQSIAFSPDGRVIVSGSQDKTLKLWDAVSGQELHTFATGVSPIGSVAFLPNGKGIVSGGLDGAVRTWDLNGNMLAISVSRPDGEWLTIIPEGFFDASSPKGGEAVSLVRGLGVSSIDQVYNALYRPDLVREKLAGDPEGKVKAAAAKLDLGKVMASGVAPKVAITAPATGTFSPVDEVEVQASITDQGGGIGKVEWRVNGVTLGVETRGLERIDSGNGGAGKPSAAVQTVKRKLALERGDNRIEVLAYNAKNLIASEAAQITIKWDGEKTATPPKLYVLAVGVNDYYDSRLRLAYAVPDATALAEGFRKAGAGLYAGVELTKVLDADVTIANLDKVFSDLGGKVQPRDVFVFFLAGHGKTRNGRYYFLPRDFRYEDESSIEKAGMDQDRFQAWFARIGARKSILLYDTCESGSLTGNTRGSDIDERLGALNRMARATGRTFLTATTDDAPALEGYHGHGVFTYALLDALDHADVNKNGLIEVSELADYIDQKVPDFSFEAFKLRQIPQRSIVGNNFPLTNKAEVLPLESSSSANKRDSNPPTETAGSGKPTHVVITQIDVKAVIGAGSETVTRLAAGTQVQLIRSENGWTMVAREGQEIGYVPQDALAALQ